LTLKTNGGTLQTNYRTAVPGFGEVWFHDKAVTNIFSLSEMETKYPITFDSRDKSAFIFHKSTGQVKFIKSVIGLYFYKSAYEIDNQASFVETIVENKCFSLILNLKELRNPESYIRY
jgi:hypothetical protein